VEVRGGAPEFDEGGGVEGLAGFVCPVCGPDVVGLLVREVRAGVAVGTAGACEDDFAAFGVGRELAVA